MQWYGMNIEVVKECLSTSEQGLTESEAAKRLTQYGPNRLVDEAKISRLVILLHQFTSPLIYILLIAAAVTVFLREYIDTGVILAVVLLNALIGYIQEFKAEKSVRALKRLLVAKARVIREGMEKEISGAELVPGDVVLLASGTRVPADLRLLHTNELRVDEAMLTGESLPVEKTTAVIEGDNLTHADQLNMVFMGTAVVNGRAKGVVTATASATALGEIADEASDMVLANDNFASIFSAVREGRIVFDNLRKVTFFLIPTGVAAIISIMITLILGFPIPYLPAQLLWINLVTNGLQDVSLAFEPGEKGIVNRRPRHPQESIFSRLLMQRTILVGLVISAGVVWNYTEALNEGNSQENARTVAVTTMVFFQFFQAWNSRSEHQSIFGINVFGNILLFYSMIAAFFAQLAFVYAPPLQWVFRTVPLTGMEWLRIVAVSATVLMVVELDKWLRGRRTVAAATGASSTL